MTKEDFEKYRDTIVQAVEDLIEAHLKKVGARYEECNQQDEDLIDAWMGLFFVLEFAFQNLIPEYQENVPSLLGY